MLFTRRTLWVKSLTSSSSTAFTASFSFSKLFPSRLALLPACSSRLACSSCPAGNGPCWVIIVLIAVYFQ